MANLMDYLDWRGDLTLRQAGINDVDLLILSRLSYFPFDGVVPSQQDGGSVTVAEAASAEFQKDFLQKEDRVLLHALAESGRFSGMKLTGYINKIDPDAQEQFSAVTVLPGNGETVAAYRGTDSTLVGWKEDFNMGYLTPVPAQREAVRYLIQAADRTQGGVRLAGHSKGGNLAVYAAAYCPPDVRERLLSVNNNDGPGFSSAVMEEPGYQAVRGRIRTFVPQSSIVGMLLDHEEEYTVVHSTQVGVLQHDLYTWEVKRDDFVRLDTVTSSSRFADLTLKAWIAGMEPEEREKFSDALYEILSATNAKTVTELSAAWFKSAVAILQSLKNVEEPTKQLLYELLGRLLKSARENLPQVLPKTRGKV